MAAAIPAAVQAAGVLGGAALASRSAGKANKTAAEANREAIAYQREQDAKEEARYREQEAKLEAQWLAQEAEAAPYRQAAEALLGQNAGRLGLPFSPSARPTARPVAWTPGQPQGSPRTLSALAGANSGQVYDVPAVQAPQMSLSDVVNSRWGAVRS